MGRTIVSNKGAEVLYAATLTISNADKETIREIKEDLTMTNPDYALKLAIGIPTWGIPSKLKLYKEDATGLHIPRGYMNRLEHHGIHMIFDYSTVVRSGRFPSAPKLREYQAGAKETVKEHAQGVLMLPCGAGKTEIGMAIIEEHKQKTLWITHTLDLLKQSRDRAKTSLGLKDEELGLIQGQNHIITDHITFATVQTLSAMNKKELSELGQMFGCVIVDECHLVFKDGVKVRMFEKVMDCMTARYRYGLTASESRADGLISSMHAIMGPVIFEVGQKELNDAGYVSVPSVRFIDHRLEYEILGDMLNMQHLYSHIAEDTSRNNIIKCLISESLNAGRVILVLGDRVDHLKSLCSEYPDGVIVHGKSGKKIRESALSDMKSGKKKILFATYQLAKLGLDIPILSCLILASPKKDATSIQQAVGRVMRPAEGKPEPVVYDIFDKGVTQLRYWAYKRLKVYEKLGIKNIINNPKIKNRRV